VEEDADGLSLPEAALLAAGAPLLLPVGLLLPPMRSAAPLPLAEWTGLFKVQDAQRCKLKRNGGPGH
jgi:hypothetical protein